MTRARTSLPLLTATSLLAVTACTDPGAMGPNDPNRQTKQGALLGGILGAGVGALGEGDTLGFQFGLQVAHIGEIVERSEIRDPLRIIGEAGIEGEDVLLEHLLEQADDRAAVDEDRIAALAAGLLEAQLLVEGLAFREVLHRKADRKRTQFHCRSPSGELVP